LVAIDEAIKRSLSNRRARPVSELTDPHHLADTDPVWAGGDTRRIKQVAETVTPSIAWPVFGLLDVVPGPVAAALRTGLDTLINLKPKARSA
jgi:hypothetical protein